MKRLKWYFFAVILGAGLILNGCEDDDNDPIGPGGNTASGNFTLNGAGYNNQSVNIIAGGAVYDTTERETSVILYGLVNDDTSTVTVTFPGETTGMFTWNDTVYVTFYTNISTPFIGQEGGTTTITSYGNVGGNVAGNFSGTLFIIGGDSLNISGNFSARRIADVGF